MPTIRQNALIGLLACIAIAIASIRLSQMGFYPFRTPTGHHPIDPIIIALIIGILCSTFARIPEILNDGIAFSAGPLLGIAIALLGSQLSWQSIAHLPLSTVAVVLISALASFAIIMVLARIFGLSTQSGAIVAIGTAVCGNAAVMAACKTLKHDNHNETAVVIATLNLMGLLAIFVLPLIAHYLNWDSRLFGAWAGASIQSVAQVVTAGFAYSTIAGHSALVVKLGRILLLAPFLLICRFIAKPQSTTESGISVPWYKLCPPFLIAFFILIAFNSIGTFNAWHLDKQIFYPRLILSDVANFLLTMAIAAVGLKSSLRSLKASSGNVLLLTVLGGVLITAISLGCISLMA